MKKDNYIVLDLKNKAFLQTVLVVFLISVSVIVFQNRRNVKRLNKEIIILNSEINKAQNSIYDLEVKLSDYQSKVERMKREIDDLERDGNYWW